ncbi:hypothetical protein ASD00_33300 [Ensifer sp. Root31]|nr:hypothetical protein ASD00_33300 [Ensifer sp. Root31]
MLDAIRERRRPVARDGNADWQCNLVIDFAISQEVDDSLPPILGILEAVDPSFRAVPHQADKARVTAFVNRTNFSTGNPASPAVISVTIIAHENSARRIP